MTLLERELWGNPAVAWLAALGVAALVAIGLQVLRWLVVRRARRIADRTGTRLDDLLVAILSATSSLFVLAVALFAGSRLLLLPDRAIVLIRSAVVVVLFVQLALWANRAINVWFQDYLSRKRQQDAAAATILGLFGILARIAVWSIVLLMILDNLGFEVTTLVAGLGVGGVAVALAVQNILGDIFGSVSIALDKPFVIGDFIIVGDMLGTVEYVGIKTTRLRSLSGEQLVISNADLLQSRIRNYKRMFERRVTLNLGVVRQTPLDQAQRIPALMRAAIEAQDRTRFDRAHLRELGDFALIYEAIFFVRDPDYNVYMDIQQAILLRLLQDFRAEGIELAYPTRTVFSTAVPKD